MSTQALAFDTDPPKADEISTRGLLISIQPKYVEAILGGTKTLELRRTNPTLAPGALALLYATSPTKALVGWARVEGIVQATPRTLWRTHAQQTGVTRGEFWDYFAGATMAYGLQLGHVSGANHVMSLSGLRRHNLEPPQSWRYLRSELVSRLRDELTAEFRPPN